MKDWTKVKLGDLLKESKVESLYPDTTRRIRVKLNLGGVDKRPALNEKKGATKYFCRKAGQFIYGKQNLHKGAFGIIPAELDGFESSSDLPSFDVDEKCFSEWIYYFFKQGDFYLKLAGLAKGIGSKRIQPLQLFDLEISVPPKEEQRRILDAVKVFESDATLLTLELQKQASIIARMKTAYLNEALVGSHTVEWRKQNRNIETAKNLLAKASNQNFKEIAPVDSSGKYDGQKKKSNKEIPPTWVECLLGEYVITERGRFSARPRNDPKYFHGEIPYIQIGDLPPNGGLVSRHTQTLNELGLTVSKQFPAGTIVIAIVGATIGNTGILDYDMCFPDSIVGIKPNSNFNTHFIEYFLRSKRDYLRSVAYSGGGQPNIKLPTINNCQLLLAPFEEQEEIVLKLNGVFEYCDKFIDNIGKQISYIGNITKSELTKIWSIENILPKSISIMNEDLDERTYKKLLDTVKLYDDSEKGNLDIEVLLKQNGKMSSVSLWQMSKFHSNIDSFYEALKELIDIKKTVKESAEKGYLELI